MDDQVAWDLFFAGAVGWCLHPGYLKDPMERPNMEFCADLADEMMALRRERFPVGFRVYGPDGQLKETG